MRFRFSLICVFLVVCSLQMFAQQAPYEPPTWTMHTLYMFTGYADGAGPLAGVVMDSAGDLYGTTWQGGNLNDCNGYGCGVVYRVGTNNAEAILHTFIAGADGYAPWAGLVRNSSGALFYGAASGGNGGAGTVFQIAPKPTPCKTAFCPWNLTTIYPFSFTDGNGPQASLLRDSSGNLYGTTVAGGAGCQPNGCGTVFKVDPQGHHTILYSFNGTDGNSPMCTLLMDPSGNLYGTTYKGGLHNEGTVFKLDPNGGLTTLWNFAGGSDGANPTAGVVADQNWNLYGTTQFGGTHNGGVAYEVVPASKMETVRHNFQGVGPGSDGNSPLSPLLMDGSGNFYGTAGGGGSSGDGVIYKFDSQFNETIIWNFTGADGAYPTYGSLIMDQHGNLYGTTNQGGDYNSMAPACYIQNVGPLGCGVVFKLSPPQ